MELSATGHVKIRLKMSKRDSTTTILQKAPYTFLREARMKLEVKEHKNA